MTSLDSLTLLGCGIALGYLCPQALRRFRALSALHEARATQQAELRAAKVVQSWVVPQLLSARLRPGDFSQGGTLVLDARVVTNASLMAQLSEKRA